MNQAGPTNLDRELLRAPSLGGIPEGGKMKDEEKGRGGKGPSSVTNDDNLTPAQRFARAVHRRDALIRDRERLDPAADNHEKRRRIINPVPAK